MREHFYSFIFFFLCSEHQHRTKNVCSSKTMTSLRTELSVDPLKNQLKQQNIKKNNITRYKRELFFKGRLLRLLVFLQSWRVSEQSIQIAFHKNTMRSIPVPPPLNYAKKKVQFLGFKKESSILSTVQSLLNFKCPPTPLESVKGAKKSIA